MTHTEIRATIDARVGGHRPAAFDDALERVAQKLVEDVLDPALGNDIESTLADAAMSIDGAPIDQATLAENTQIKDLVSELNRKLREQGWFSDVDADAVVELQSGSTGKRWVYENGKWVLKDDEEESTAFFEVGPLNAGQIVKATGVQLAEDATVTFGLEVVRQGQTA